MKNAASRDPSASGHERQRLPQCGFADTAGTDDADEAPYLELLRQGSNSVIAADHSCWLAAVAF